MSREHRLQNSRAHRLQTPTPNAHAPAFRLSLSRSVRKLTASRMAPGNWNPQNPNQPKLLHFETDTATAYLVSEDFESVPLSQKIDATHAYKLPGLRCPNCGIWSTIGVQYPTANAELFLHDPELPQALSPISIERFKDVSERIRMRIDSSLLIVPGAEFGPLRGRAKGTFPDFTWPTPWETLVRESVWLKLRQQGLELAGAPAELFSAKSCHEPLVELEVLPTARLLPDLVPPRCDLCGRLGLKVPDRILLDFKSFDASIPLQRIIELPTILVANKALKDACVQMRCRGIAFKPLIAQE